MRMKLASSTRIMLGLVLAAVTGMVILPGASLERGHAGELEGPRPQDRRVALTISALMPRRHISGDKLNDEYSQRAMKIFLESLDPMKLYFYQSDIDVFSQKRLEIDDMVRRGDVAFAYEVFQRFLERVDERVVLVDELLQGEFDFDREESIVVDPDAARYAVSPDDARERWRRQLKYNILVLEEDGKTEAEAREQLGRRYHRNAKRWHQFKDDKLLEVFLTSVTSSYDPHTTYMAPSTLENFEITMRLNLEGIGASLQEKDGVTVVSKVIPGGAAAKAGELEADDHIVSVGQGDEGEMVDVVEMPLDDVVSLIRGPAGTVVRLGVKAGGVGEVKTLTITRAKVELEESAARGEVVERGQKSDGTPYRIGYINLPSFYMDMEGARSGRADYRSSTRDVARILADFRRQSVDTVVLDLSTNGGGSLTEAINLTGLFIDKGPVVQVKDSAGNVTAYSDENSGVAWDGPLVVMTSKLSASASEILAGAIKDYRRGLIVGDQTTHGKGTVQTLMDLDRELFNAGQPMGALKVTLQQFYLPDGASTQRSGVQADVVLPSLTTHMDIGEADLDYALPSGRVPAQDHESFRMVPPEVLGVVRARSADRIKSNEEFAELLESIDMFRRQKDKQFVPLNRAAFKAYRDEFNAQREEVEAITEAPENEDRVFSDSFYNQEVLDIAIDYLDTLRLKNLAKAG